jgi:hypothetical protein
VVAWSTVRLVLCIATLLSLETQQVDYVQAFTQAELDDPVYMRIPEGWGLVDKSGKNLDNKVIKLVRNLYGTKQAARLWFQKLDAALKGHGFRSSSVDPCLYIRNDCLLVLYTDDCLVFAPKRDIITKLVADLSENFRLEDNEGVEEFLGVKIDRDPKTKTINMTQPGLIDSILSDLGLDSKSTKKFIPASMILFPDPDGEDRQEHTKWNYRSVVGKLSYLAQMTRPDIAYAVHMCARFCAKPKLIHEKAVKYLGRYLLSTRDQGLILKPTTTFSLDAYVDADFAGLWHRNFAELRETALSRTGYIITFCGCPIFWKSKLQSEVALSTTEAEYIALSMCMRDLLPMRRLLSELSKQFCKFELENSRAVTGHLESADLKGKLPPSAVYEDNAGCVILASDDDKYRARTKHINIKWHHFKDQVRNGSVKIIKVDTTLNWADTLTKPLSRVKLESLRKLIQGW